MKPYQKINHFVGTHAITRKNFLGRNLQRMKAYYPKEYKYFPSTWILPTDGAGLLAQFADKKKKTFIIKPDSGSQGRGIYLTQNINDIELSEHFVAQRYIHKPFLLDGLKFDLRLYVLLAGCNPLRLFLHRDGLVRFATHQYEAPNPSNCKDLKMHLTNYAINKSSSEFHFSQNPQEATDGHKRSLFHVLERLRQEGRDVDSICSKIHDMLIKTIITIYPSLTHIYSSCKAQDTTNSVCFEIFGVDVLLDHKLQPWLIEVNHSPSFATDSALDKQVKFAVIRDAVKLVGISAKNRKRYLAAQKATLDRSLKTSLPSVQKREERMRVKAEAEAECARQQTDWEDRHLGGYQRIYPTNDGEEKYRKFFDAAKEIWGNSTGVSKSRPIWDQIQQNKQSKLDEEASSAVKPAVVTMQPNCWTEEKAHERRKPIEKSNTANTYIRNGRSTSTVSSIVGQTKRPSDSQRFRASSVMSQLLFASQAHRRFHHLRSHQKPIHERPPQAHFLGKFSTDRQQRWLPLTHVPGLCHTKEPAGGESCLDIVLSPGSDSLPSCKEEKRVQVPSHQEQEDVLSHVPIENSSEASDAPRRGLDYIGHCGRKARQAGDGTVAGSVLHPFDLTTAAPPVLCVSTSSTSPSGSSSSFDATRRVLIPPDGGSQQQSDMPGCGQGMQSRSSICLGRKHPAWAARARAAATKTCNAIRGVPMSLPCVELSLGIQPAAATKMHRHHEARAAHEGAQIEECENRIFSTR
ncbi:probable beta-tubulin polyglutamylase [Cyclospora cayetanensis]|uniref:Probable beta-tubulin polyglutamylase n=1 Tax=Cyclospora cayetanensis TaxID=88456 RepID=A0A6P6RSZ7_9EIME|nr:probable beta-tubulin polyglutamylase [Cyclospora cayetanensis]